jgi:anti-anti-sigma regulatory factor
MNPRARPPYIATEQLGGVTVVRFLPNHLYDSLTIQVMGDELSRVVDETVRANLVLDFSRVTRVSSAVLGKFITLHRKVQLARGRLMFCCVPSQLFEFFQITKLDKIFAIAPRPPFETAAHVTSEFFGELVRPVTFDPAWRTDTAVAVARQMHDAGEYGAMPILADALQDAGCEDEHVLAHCRDVSQPHTRDCWVCRLVLGTV